MQEKSSTDEFLGMINGDMKILCDFLHETEFMEYFIRRLLNENTQRDSLYFSSGSWGLSVMCVNPRYARGRASENYISNWSSDGLITIPRITTCKTGYSDLIVDIALTREFMSELEYRIISNELYAIYSDDLSHI
jgi:hypothetical protein